MLPSVREQKSQTEAGRRQREGARRMLSEGCGMKTDRWKERGGKFFLKTVSEVLNVGDAFFF